MLKLVPFCFSNVPGDGSAGRQGEFKWFVYSTVSYVRVPSSILRVHKLSAGWTSVSSVSALFPRLVCNSWRSIAAVFTRMQSRPNWGGIDCHQV
jgi:hypothetical protein